MIQFKDESEFQKYCLAKFGTVFQEMMDDGVDIALLKTESGELVDAEIFKENSFSVNMLDVVNTIMHFAEKAETEMRIPDQEEEA